MIRPARFSDVPAMYALLAEGFERSRYRTMGAIDQKVAKGLLVQAIQRDGQPGEGGTLVRVADQDGVVEGMIIAVLQRVYHIGDKLQATDLFYIGSPRCHPADGRGLFDAMVAWADGNPRVVEILATVTDVLLDDWPRVGRLYERRGFVPCGGMWRRKTQALVNAAASNRFVDVGAEADKCPAH